MNAVNRVFKPFAAVISLIACISLTARAAGDNGDLFPLKPKNWWSYTTIDGDGKVAKVKFEVVSAKPGKDGATVFKVVLAGSKEAEAKYYCKQGYKTVLQRVESKSQPSLSVNYVPAKLIIDSKIRPGSVFQWTGNRMVPVCETERWQVFPTEKVIVPAGQFECVRIGGLTVRDNVMVYQSKWFARNVGLVKSVDVKGSKKLTQELCAFRVN